eukprot:7388296-Prymnesium_polylepis.2
MERVLRGNERGTARPRVVRLLSKGICVSAAAAVFENRFLRIGPAALSFMTQIVSNSTPMKGHVLPAEHKTMRERLRCSPGQCSGGALWEVSLVHGAH